jgi:hypothetical protein
LVYHCTSQQKGVADRWNETGKRLKKPHPAVPEARRAAAPGIQIRPAAGLLELGVCVDRRVAPPRRFGRQQGGRGHPVDAGHVAPEGAGVGEGDEGEVAAGGAGRGQVLFVWGLGSGVVGGVSAEWWVD